MTSPHFTLLNEPTPAEKASRRNVSYTLLAVVIVTASVTTASGFILRSRLHVAAVSLERDALSRAETAFGHSLASAGESLVSLARVMVDDARVRTTLATPGIDNETIDDLLKDLKVSTGVSIIGVLENGRVRVCIGNESLARADLSGTNLLKEAWDVGRSSGIWALNDELLAVAMAPIQLASDPPRLLMLGRAVGDAELGFVQNMTATVGALSINGRSVAGEGMLAQLSANLDAGEHVVRGPSPIRVRVSSISGVSLPVRTIWRFANVDATRETTSRWLINVLGISALLTALTAAILLVLIRGQSTTFDK